MALIGKIRNNMWLVFVLIALATAAFILMDASGPGGFGGPTSNTPIGVIAGEKVNQMDFERSYQALFNNTQNPNAGRELLWNYVVEEKIIGKEAEKLGLSIGNEELEDLQFGTNLSPVIRQNFTNPQTGQLDISQLQQIRNQIQSGGALNPSLTAFWSEQEKQIVKEQLEVKISSLAEKALYAPNWMAESGYQEENATVDVALVKIPFDNIPSDNISVTDADLNNYLSDNSDDYELEEENRVIDYLEVAVTPSVADSAAIRDRMNQLIQDFATASDDSTFAVVNNGSVTPIYINPAQLDDFYQEKIPTYEVGNVYGPYTIQNSFQALKLLDKRVLPDSVKARHILINVAQGNITQLNEANSLIDSLYNVLRYNRSKFAELAEQFSQDQTNNTQGGDLGYFAQGRMVKSFNDICFLEGRAGNLYKVRTRFGVHLVYIEDQKYLTREPSYKVASVNIKITPSEETESAAYTTMLNLISDYPYLEELKSAAASDPSIRVTTSPNLAINDYSIPSLGDELTSREIVKWAFDKERAINDVSQTVYEYSDPIDFYTNKYVVIGLKRIIDPGMPAIDDIRSQIEFAVMNQLKGEKIVNEISSTNLGSIASNYGVVVDTLYNVNLLNNFVAGIGNEPEIIGTAFGQNVGDVSAPILGQSGVYVVKTINKVDAGETTNIAFIKRQMAANKKSGLRIGLKEALKSFHDIKDNRAIFY